MIGRQRIVKDGFWRDPVMATLTTEDKYCLLYLHTSPFSNTIGVYSFVPSIMAAELGWDTNSQLSPVLTRLVSKGLLAINTEASYIWIKKWWDHNAANGLGATIKTKAIREIESMPTEWQLEYIHDLMPRLLSNKETYKWFREELRAKLPDHFSERLSLAYSVPNDSRVGNTNEQTISINNGSTPSPSEATPYKLAASIELQMHDLSTDQQHTVRHQVARAAAKGGIKTSPEIYARSLISRARAGLLVLTNTTHALDT